MTDSLQIFPPSCLTCSVVPNGRNSCTNPIVHQLECVAVGITSAPRLCAGGDQHRGWQWHPRGARDFPILKPGLLSPTSDNPGLCRLRLPRSSFSLAKCDRVSHHT